MPVRQYTRTKHKSSNLGCCFIRLLPMSKMGNVGSRVCVLRKFGPPIRRSLPGTYVRVLVLDIYGGTPNVTVKLPSKYVYTCTTWYSVALKSLIAPVHYTPAPRISAPALNKLPSYSSTRGQVAKVGQQAAVFLSLPSANLAPERRWGKHTYIRQNVLIEQPYIPGSQVRYLSAIAPAPLQHSCCSPYTETTSKGTLSSTPTTQQYLSLKVSRSQCS